MATATVARKKTERVIEYLLQQVKRSEIRVNDRFPSQTELAQKLNVSPATVGIALSQLAEQLPIEAIPGKGVFLRTESIRQRTFTIAIIGFFASRMGASGVPKQDTYWQGILHSLHHEAHLHSEAIVWIPGTDHEPLDVDRMLMHRPDCVVSFGVSLRPETVVELRRRHVPLVSGNRQCEEDGLSYVDYDTNGGFRRAAEVFHERGHRRIAALVYNAGFANLNALYYQTFCQTLVERDCLYRYADYWREFCGRVDNLFEAHEIFAQREMGALLDLPEPPTAVYCWNEFMARGAARAAEDRGLKIGHDLSVIITGCKEDSAPFSKLEEPHDELARTLLKAARELAADPHIIRQISIPKPFIDCGTVAHLNAAATIGNGK